MQFLVDECFSGQVASITPREARGCQLSLVIRDPGTAARKVYENLRGLNVSVDWREPDAIRVAAVPLYNGYADVFDFTERLRVALDDAG